MTNESMIKPHMPVVCATNEECGKVDHIEGRSLKLTKDASGKHHFLPLSWVDKVDDKVHLGRSAAEVMQAWSDLPPRGDA